MSSIIAAVLFSLIVVLNVLLILGFPVGELTMGGKYRILPKKLRIVAFASLFIQIYAIIVVLQAGGYLNLWFSVKTTRVICYVYGAYLTINSFMNFMSRSKKEKYVITPLSIITAICFFVTAASM